MINILYVAHVFFFCGKTLVSLTAIEFDADGLLLRKLYDGVTKHSTVCFSVAELSLCTFSSSIVSLCRWLSSRRALILLIEFNEARLF